MAESTSDTVDPALAEAIVAIEKAPENEQGWETLEQLADELQQPDPVFGAYRAALDKGLSKKDAPTIADRAVKFCQAWYIDTPEAMPALLEAIVAKYPAIDWAFERLVVHFTSAAKWDELLTLYDKALSATRSEKKRTKLLSEASDLAKDFADQPDRAADYLTQLLRLEPENDKHVTSLERLLERRERWDELLALWAEQIPKMSTEDARATRARIAKISLEKLGAPDRAVAELRELVEENPGHREACEQLERILALDDASIDTRREALSLLRKTYEIVERPDDVVRVLEAALAFVPGDAAHALRREAGSRLSILGRESDAMAHFAALLKDAPGDADARKQLRNLAKRSERPDLHAEALLAAAESAEDPAQQVALWLEAAAVKHTLDDLAGAISLYTQVLESDGADPTEALRAAQKLDQLLAQADRPDERLAVLERLSTLEQSPSFRRQVLGEAARLAQQQGDGARALSSWRQILEASPGDLEALDASIELLDAAEDWTALVESLRLRAAAAVSPHQRRADLVRVARVQSTNLDDAEASIATWLEVRESAGEDAEVVGELDQLLSASDKWSELGDILAGAVSRELGETANRLVRLAEVKNTHLDDTKSAVELFRQALVLNPADAAARAGITAMLDGSEAATAAEALWRAYETTNEWERLLELVPTRIAAEPSADKRAQIHADAARLYEDHESDADSATQALARAVPLAPHRLDLRASLMRLAEISDGWTVAMEALAAAAQALADEPEAAAELRMQQADIAEKHVGDWDQALSAHRAASELAPDDLVQLGHVVRCAAKATQWEVAGRGLVAHARIVGRCDQRLVGWVQDAAKETGAWSDAAAGIVAALDAGRDDLPASVASTIYGLAAEWYRDHTDDAAAATSAARAAVELTPEEAGALSRLVSLQRQTAGPELADTLMLIDRVGDERSLDALREAADVAADDDERAITVLERLYHKAAAMWQAGTEHTGAYPADHTAQWAIEQLTDRLVARNERERAARLLLAAGALPMTPQRRAELNRRAAEQLVEINRALPAIEAYRRVLADQRDDLETIQKLADLCEREEAKTGSVALRERELDLTEDLDARLALRLAISQRAAALETRSGRVEALLKNLEEQPGHAASIDALSAILDERGHYERLADVLEEQATLLSESDPDTSASLWSRAADVAERKLRLPDRAMAAHRQVVTLTSASRSLDALARLHIDKGEPGEAAKWLSQRLEAAATAERVPVLLKLAKTHQQAGREGEAINTLQTAFSEAPQNAEIRKQLLPLLRQREDYKALAATLATSVEHAGDDATVLAYAREAADIYYNRLDDPGKAVPVLRRAVELAPDDRLLKRMLGDGLRDGEELDEAKELLTALIEAFGRRGSRERAEAHLSLAKVLHVLGEHEEALEQLDTASKMDVDNVAILRTLAEQAREIGQLQRAEAALRTLLLTARRLHADGTSEVPIGTSGVLFELSSIARARGQTDQAEELAESAIEALADNDARAPALQKKLKKNGEHELLIRLLEARLGYVQSPYRRGAILGEKALVLEKLERRDDAFDARLAAIEADAGSPLLHEGTRELAVALGHLDRYTTHLQTLLDRSRRDTDAMIRCELLLRLGEVQEKDHEDLDAATAMYDEAEATGVREVDVLRARAQVAGARGDDDEQMRILGELASLGEDQVETRADALYRIAEVQLSADETLEQGLDTLRKALEDHHRPARACKVLMRATELHPEHEGLLDAYEHVARDSGDDLMLLHYLERRASHATATTDHVREAVSKARELGDATRAEKLMERAVEIGTETGDGLYALDWALLGLAEVAKERGDVDNAVKWLEKAADVAEAGPLFALCREVASMGGDGETDPAVAARLYEKLRERDPTARDAWQPLVDIYQSLGDIDALERVVRETLDGLQEVADRNTLRIGLARALLTKDARTDDAIGVLRDALFDEPGHSEALSLLTTSLERAGKADELVDLLRDQLIGSQDRGDAVAARTTAMRLGPMLEPDAAIAVYRDALALGDDRELLELIVASLDADHDPAERASLGERLLMLEDGDEAAALALELADAYQLLDDAAGQLRVLELGLERASDNATIRERLEQHYREQGDGAGLARILETTAQAATRPERKVKLLREAANVYAQDLGDANRAVELLTEAREIAPDDPGIAVTMSTCMTLNGDAAGAISMLTDAIEASGEEHALALLRARAKARRATDDDPGAIADLETAYAIAPQEVGKELFEAIDDRRMRASMNNDLEVEREATMRAIEVLLATEERERALGMLSDWTTRAPDDVDALRRLRDFEAQDSRWEDLARTSMLLIDVETGDEQAASAALLLEAYVQVGAPEHARETLERVWAQQPESARVRGEIRRLYELIGANLELAKLLIQEAATLDNDDEKVALLRWAGEALLSVGDIQSAIPALTEVLDIKPDDAQSRCLLADANVMLGRFAEAHALLDEAISTSRRSSKDLHMFHHRKAYVFHAAGDHAGQLEALKKAHQHARKNGQIAAELADLAEALEQWDLAVSTLRTITTIDEGSPITPADALVRQGRIAHRLGDDKRARLCARRASMTDADAESVKAFLAELGE